MAGKTVSGKGAAKKAKAAAKAGKADPQLRKDPAFMNLVVGAVREEMKKPRAAPPAAEAEPASPAARAAPEPAKKAPARVSPPSAGKPARKAARGSAKAESSARAALADELVSLVPELDAEGLAFLIEQARTHLYNMKVVELEAEAARLDRSSASARAISGGAARPASAGGFSIKADPGGSDYHIVHDGKWKLFSGAEMLAIAKIASSRDPLPEVAARLHRWLKAERSDFFADVPVAGPGDPRMAELVSLVRRTFVIKK